ncbi:hypothetical protein [Streptococcus dentiloxodontae]
MVSVTQRIKQINQPRGGYLPPKLFEENFLVNDTELTPVENIHPSLVGICVDYMSRFMSGSDTEEAFKISLRGAQRINKEKVAKRLLKSIRGLDNQSITSACKLAGFDVVFRSGPRGYKPIEAINPDSETISNIRTMIERSLNFFKLYGPITKDGFTFDGGYTDTITSGDGDFLTLDTLWDFKISKSKPTKEQTMQLLIYYIMGQHSVIPDFNSIKKLGIYNPRQNKVLLLKISDIPQEIIDIVSREIIGY